MRKFTFLITLAAILVSSIAVAHTDGIYNPSTNSVGDTQGIDNPKASGGGGGNPFTLDGTTQTANSGSAASLPLPAFSTTFGNDVIYVAVLSNSTPTGVTGGSLTFTLRATATNGSNNVALYSAVASSPLSSVVFTATSNTANFITAGVFAFSGSHSASPFDSNGAIPSTTGGGTPLTFTTTNANDILVTTGVSQFAVDSPFTAIFTTGGCCFLSAGYKIVSATQSGSSVTYNSANVASVGDAIIKGP